MIIPLLFTLLTVWVTTTFLRFRKARRAFGDLPARSWLLSEVGLIAPNIPRIRFLAIGVNWSLADKHEPYEKSGWDVISSTSLFPSIRNILVLADAALIKEIILDQDRIFPKFLEQYAPLKFYGDNIIASEGEVWKRYRRIAGPAFSERNNKLVWQETVRILVELFEQVLGDSDSTDVDNCLEITMTTALCVLSAAGFGRRLSWIDDGAIPRGHKMTFRKAVEVATTQFLIKLTVPQWAMGLTKRSQFVKDGFDDMHLYIKEMIEDHRSTDLSNRNDLFSNLLRANNETSSLDVQELIANTYMFLVAGIETTGHTLCFTLALLALYTDVQDKLYEHIRSIVPQGQIPTYDHMSSLKYAKAVLYESIRVFPVVSHFPKMAARDTVLTCTNRFGQEKRIPVTKGTPLVINVGALHYNPRYWEDPHAFKPERFLEDWPSDAFLPFSGGTRSCIGRKFSETESIAFLSLIVSKYRITVTEELQFAQETFEERRERVLDCTDTLTTTPIRVPLTFTRRS